ncbi:unnamed protein product, partial [Candidula unifasciata]
MELDKQDVQLISSMDGENSTSDNPMNNALPIDIGIIVFQWVLFTVLCQIVALFGIGSNIVNIICFAKQGFKDPINISLL